MYLVPTDNLLLPGSGIAEEAPDDATAQFRDTSKQDREREKEEHNVGVICRREAGTDRGTL